MRVSNLMKEKRFCTLNKDVNMNIFFIEFSYTRFIHCMLLTNFSTWFLENASYFICLNCGEELDGLYCKLFTARSLENCKNETLLGNE